MIIFSSFSYQKFKTNPMECKKKYLHEVQKSYVVYKNYRLYGVQTENREISFRDTNFLAQKLNLKRHF